MPSQPLDTGWNFSPVYDLIDSNVHDVGSPILRSETRSPSEGGVGLGNFWKLYESLGMPPEVAIEPLPPLEESELSTSDEAVQDDALLPSPILQAREAPQEHVVSEAQQQHNTTIQPAPPTTTKKQRRKARREAEKALLERSSSESQVPTAFPDVMMKDETQISLDTPTKPARAQSNVGAKIRPTSPIPASTEVHPPRNPMTAPRPVQYTQSRSSMPVTPQAQTQTRSSMGGNAQNTTDTPTTVQYAPPPQYFSQPQQSQMSLPVGSGLVPRTVRPVAVPRHSHPAATQQRMLATPSPAPFPLDLATPRSLIRIVIRSQVDRHFHLFEKLLVRFPQERKWLVAPRQLVNENTRAEGVHVFVDASNIMIGFKDMLRNHGIPLYDMSFDSLALLMERRRPVAKRVFVGSHREASPLPHIQRLVETSKAVGYECNVQEQVFIAREDSKKKKFFNDVNKLGWQKAIQKRSGSGSDSETGPVAPKTPSAPKWVEQGVDELLHLKMCQSILDTEVPSTMVLATGDGAEAEMSDGFLAHVERALRKGWKVELITWRQQTNGGYKRRAFRQKWSEQFVITELDDFLEDLIDTP